MRLRLIAVGSRMPKWVEEGWHEYAKRLPSELALELVEIPLNTRGKNADVARFIRQEGEAMLAKVGPGERIDKQRAGRDLSGDTQRVGRTCRQPDAASGRDNPVAHRRVNPHHAAENMQQLGAVMLMPVFLVTVSIIMGKGHQRAVLKGEGGGRRHGGVGKAARRQASGRGGSTRCAVPAVFLLAGPALRCCSREHHAR